MKSFKYVVKENVGIHARPASMLVKEAASYTSAVTIESGGKKADVKRLLALMALGVKCSQEVTFFIEGEDENIAAIELERFCSRNL
ncbi:MAG TPA: HPr family phosphocarrier protein [Anaerovoracaceae bacterium]|nr:HPr family phosphocarrier protein [Anaerovoracaceae bacterium]